MGCQKGENYQCHFVKGSEIAHIRMSKIDDTLQSLSLEKERVATYEVAITDIAAGTATHQRHGRDRRTGRHEPVQVLGATMQTGNKQNVARMKRSVIRDMQCISRIPACCIRATRGENHD